MDLDALLQQLGPAVARADERFARTAHRRVCVPTGWQALDDALPGGGLPRGVVELAGIRGSARGSARVHGGVTAVAVAAIRGLQERSPAAWAGWVDAEGTLYGPGLATAGVDLHRLLVVRPPLDRVNAAAVKLVDAQAFDVLVVEPRFEGGPARGRGSPESVVSRLALAAEASGATVILLTEDRAEATPLPVTMRIVCERPTPRDLRLRITKDKGGYAGLAKTVPAHPWSGPLVSNRVSKAG